MVNGRLAGKKGPYNHDPHQHVAQHGHQILQVAREVDRILSGTVSMFK